MAQKGKIALKRPKKEPILKSSLAQNCLWYVKNVLFNPEYVWAMATFILLLEVLLNIFIIRNVRYTEIDWKAYMEEVEGFLNGTFNYYELKGGTGSLVYPAGFVYMFSILYYLTEHGKNILTAQYIFMFIYLIFLCVVFRIYKVTKKVPPYVLLISCCISYRIHSLFVLRLFNDSVAILLLYLSINMFLENRWTLGSVIYSCAVSVKMNILLYSPALLIAYVTILGFFKTLQQLLICAGVQIILGLPFLFSNPEAYILRSFNLGRVFLYQWTVNWRFLPESTFLNRNFHLMLLSAHLLTLTLFSVCWYKYLKSYSVLQRVTIDIQNQLKKYKKAVNTDVKSRLLVLPFFTCNFIGILFSRSLHYQFYVWYYHTLPYLLWSTRYQDRTKLLCLGIIELCWNTYPSTSLSSISLLACHLFILYGLFSNRYGAEKKTVQSTLQAKVTQ